MSRALKGTLDHFQHAPRRGDGLLQAGDVVSPYLRTDEAARYLRFKTARLFREWATRQGVPVARTGRVLLYDRRVLDDFVTAKEWTKRRSA